MLKTQDTPIVYRVTMILRRIKMLDITAQPNHSPDDIALGIYIEWNTKQHAPSIDKNPMTFLKSAYEIWHVLEHIKTQNYVERFICER